MHKYMASYMAQKKVGHEHGRVFLELEFELNTIENVKKAEQIVLDDYRDGVPDNLFFTNFIKLEG